MYENINSDRGLPWLRIFKEINKGFEFSNKSSVKYSFVEIMIHTVYIPVQMCIYPYA